MFCPACGDIMETARLVYNDRFKKVYKCTICNKGFIYKWLSEKEVDTLIKRQMNKDKRRKQ